MRELDVKELETINGGWWSKEESVDIGTCKMWLD
ncbi:bacteriocin [Staphylococcus haemolyticus]|nr:bacteriocin [Staphylococcus haemolyticus]